MKKIIILYLLIVALLIACHSDKKKIATKKEITLPSKSTIVDTSAILLKQTYLHAFSDQVKLDTFKLVMKGTSINNGKVKFEIISFKNKKIYSENFDTFDLLGDLDGLSPKQSEDTIRTRFRNFFSADAFSAPALDKIDTTDTDYVDLKTQKDISSDTTAIGFTYAVGYEGLTEIAYSKKNKKTVVCFASD